MTYLLHKTVEFSIFSIAKYFFVTLPLFVIFYLAGKDYFKSNKIQKKEATRKDFIREIGNSAASSVVMTIVFVLVIFTPVREITAFSKLHFSIVRILLTVLGALVIHDTYFYWMHRLMHHHPLIFKHIHLTHHRSVNPSPFTSYSFHFLEAIAEAMVIPIIMLILPTNVFTIWIFLSASFCINVYGHLGYEIMPLWFRKTQMFNFFNTSVYHNLHHSHFKGNYGLYFRFWDKIMKTENQDYTKKYDAVQEMRLYGKTPKDISIK